MKVGTDGVLLGTWTPFEKDKGTIVDFGTGTGIISLIMAQRTNARIYGIEKDPEACKQAKENFENSPWAERLFPVNVSIQEFVASNKDFADLCIMNPPYFQNHLKSSDERLKLARHSDYKGPSEWLTAAKSLIKSDGKISLIMSNQTVDLWKKSANNLGLFTEMIVYVSTKPSKPAARVLILFSKSFAHLIEKSLILEQSDSRNPTHEFKKLTEDFYLDC